MTSESTSVRIDKYLWAVRIFKTRTMASDACERKKVIILDVAVKPSRNVKIGEIIHVKQTGITRQFQVLGIISNRVSAKLAVGYIKEVTPEEEIKRYQSTQENIFYVRDRGEGRPTKKERRVLDDLLEGW